jgi:hypothetical protein
LDLSPFGAIGKEITKCLTEKNRRYERKYLDSRRILAEQAGSGNHLIGCACQALPDRISEFSGSNFDCLQFQIDPQQLAVG